MRRRLGIFGALVLAALAFASHAYSVGPWPGLAAAATAADGSRYSASRTDYQTLVRAQRAGAASRSLRVAGRWGIPAITSTGVAGGLSPAGNLLVLAEPPSFAGLRSTSRFLILATRPLRLRNTLELPGEFGFDAISGDGRTLYLIQHRSRADLVSYVVRGYDLVARRLLPGVIVAKGEEGPMRGYPVARASSRNGTWVYTLYHKPNGNPFVHALNTNHRFAICIDLPAQANVTNIWNLRLKLTSDQKRLQVRNNDDLLASINTQTYRVE
jgi:hypothetical protein